MLAFVAFFLFLGFGVDVFYLGAGGGFPVGSAIAFGVGSVSAAVSYFSGDRAVLLSTAARPIEELQASATDDDRLKLRQLENIVDEMAIASGLPRPKVYIVPDADPNAFATGRDPAHASLAVTRGLLDALDREELQGVVAPSRPHPQPRRPGDDHGRGARRRGGAPGRLGGARDDVGRRAPPRSR